MRKRNGSKATRNRVAATAASLCPSPRTLSSVKFVEQNTAMVRSRTRGTILANSWFFCSSLKLNISAATSLYGRFRAAARRPPAAPVLTASADCSQSMACWLVPGETTGNPLRSTRDLPRTVSLLAAWGGRCDGEVFRILRVACAAGKNACGALAMHTPPMQLAATTATRRPALRLFIAVLPHAVIVSGSLRLNVEGLVQVGQPCA
mmetsp:Transcript_21829/g.40161  ORF Transcript_21829/g.40161 Transcript_21829/m.40161 type:complete len:206 (+) Transcript_21829:960-1577(+)